MTRWQTLLSVSLLVLVPNVLAVHPEASTPAELADHVKAEMAKWEPVVRDANISMD